MTRTSPWPEPSERSASRWSRRYGPRVERARRHDPDRDPRYTTMTSKKVFVGVLAVAVAAAGCHGGEARETEAARQTTVMLSTADVATAEVQPVGLGAAVTGTLRPYREVEVRAQVPGLVTGLR